MRHFSKILISIDPAISSHETSDETGIIVLAKTFTQNVVILKDLSGKYSPQEWSQRAVNAYKDYQATLIVAEVNQGGEMVEHTLRTINPFIRFKPLRAKIGKYERAIPIAALYRQGKIYHAEKFKELEEQLLMLTHSLKNSPDRADALVWGIRELLFSSESKGKIGMEYL